MLAAALLAALVAPAAAQPQPEALEPAFAAARAAAVPEGALSAPERGALVAGLPAVARHGDGRPAVAVNLLFLGTQDQVERALRWAGWHPVPRSYEESFRLGFNELSEGRPMQSFPPFKTFYVDGRPQALNWARAVDARSRHHFRLWRAAGFDALGRGLWQGAGDFDKAVRWSRLDHIADADIDSERSYIAGTLRDCPFVARVSLVARPTGSSERHGGGANFRTDGRVLVVELAPGMPAPSLPPGLR